MQAPHAPRHWSLHQLLRLKGRGLLARSPAPAKALLRCPGAGPPLKQAPALAHAPDGARPDSGLPVLRSPACVPGLYPLTSRLFYSTFAPTTFITKQTRDKESQRLHAQELLLILHSCLSVRMQTHP